MKRSHLIAKMALTSLATLAPEFAIAQTLIPLRLGSVISDAYGEPYFGDDAGIFKQNGIALEISSLANSAAIAAAVVGGSLDVGNGSPTQVTGARENGFPFYFFVPGALFVAEAPSTVLVVSKNSPAQKAADLNGKTIATENLKSIPQLSVIEWMGKNGGDASSLKWVEIPSPTMGVALETKRIDAAVLAEPFLSAARDKNRIFASPFEALGRSWYLSAYFSTKSWLDANTALARRFANAMLQCATYCNAHQKETSETLERLTKMQHDVIGSLTRARFAEKPIDAALMEPLIGIALKNGLLPRPIATKEMIYAL
jgi:NitT/TauT family transport system substrate-binding protein